MSTQLTQNVAVAGRVTAVLRAVSKRNNDNATSSRDELTALRCRTVAFFPLVSSLVLTQVLVRSTVFEYFANTSTLTTIYSLRSKYPDTCEVF